MPAFVRQILSYIAVAAAAAALTFYSAPTKIAVETVEVLVEVPVVSNTNAAEPPPPPYVLAAAQAICDWDVEYLTKYAAQIATAEQIRSTAEQIALDGARCGGWRYLGAMIDSTGKTSYLWIEHIVKRGTEGDVWWLAVFDEKSGMLQELQ